MAPLEILGLRPDAADQLLDLLEARVPKQPALVDLSSTGADEAVVFGDSHGDWRSVQGVVAQYEEPSRRRLLVGLGDYVDRSPPDCGAGAVANALYLLQLAARDPERVVLIQGNHETVRAIPPQPESLRREVRELWGADPRRYERLIDLLGRGPLAAYRSGGPFLAHAGIPAIADGLDWRADFKRVDAGLVGRIAWAGCAASRNRRGVAEPFDEPRLSTFLTVAGLSFMLRGHDPDLAGQRLYHDRCLTLHTTRIYERFGGVIYARVPLDRPRVLLGQVRVEHVDTEGRNFSAP